MQLLQLTTTNSKNLEEFITFWSQQYFYRYESIYNDTIFKNEFNLADMQNLFTWKNGMKLSKAKYKALEQKILVKLPLINILKSENEFDLKIFRNEFGNISAVWKIFLLHIIKPNDFPIYDQHVHRAFLFIHEQEYSHASEKITDKEKELFYFEEYLSFIRYNNINDIKKLDEAFFAFGQFLNTRHYRLLFNNLDYPNSTDL